MKISIGILLPVMILFSVIFTGVGYSQDLETEIIVLPVITETSTCETVTFEVWVLNVQDLSAFHLEIDFIPSHIEVLDVVNGGFLGGADENALFEPTNGFDNENGKVLFGLALIGTGGDPNPKNGEGKLIEITLRVKTSGDIVPFTIAGAKSTLINWPDVSFIPFVITNPDVMQITSCSPTDIMLTPHSVREQLPVGTVVGTLKSTDQDISDSWTYSLEKYITYPDNDIFAISGDKVVTRYVLDFNTRSTFTIYVRSTDAGGSFFEKEIIINVLEDGDPEIEPIGDQEIVSGNTLTFTVLATDPEGAPLTYSLGDSAPTGATIDPTTGVFSWDTIGVEPGDYAFDVCVSDGVNTICETITVTVAAAPEPQPIKIYLPIIFR